MKSVEKRPVTPHYYCNGVATHLGNALCTTPNVGGIRFFVVLDTRAVGHMDVAFGTKNADSSDY